MATIARMLVELAGDASGLRRMFQQAARDSATFGAEMRAAIAARPLVDSARAAAQGRDAAQGMVAAFTRQYDTQMASAREQLARGALDRNGFARAGEAAAVEFNREVLNGIADLRRHSMLPADVHNQLVAELKDAGMEAGRAAREQVERELRALGGSMESLGRSLSSAGRSMMTNVTLPLLAIGGASIKAASDAEESANKFQVIYGRMAEGVNKELAELHRTIPLTTAQLQEQAANFQQLLVPMGLVPSRAAQMSVALVKLGGDIVSLNNSAQKETLDRLFSGLVGEAESVRRFGVDISEARLKVLAHNAGLGDNVQVLDRATKTQLIFNEIMRSTTLAQGDAARTVDSASNSFRFLRRDATEAAAALGQQLLPVVVPMLQSLSRVLAVVSTLSPQTLDMAIKFGLVAAAIGPVLLVMGNLITAVGTMITAWATLGPIMAGAVAILAGPAGWIVAIGAAVAATIGWISWNNRARQSNEELAASYRGLGEAQLRQQTQAQTAREFALLQEQARLRQLVKPGDIATPTVGQMVAPAIGQRVNPAVGQLAEVNRELDETRANLRGLTTAWNTLAETHTQQRAEQARIFAANDAAAAALAANMNNSLGLAKAAAAAARAQRKDELQAMQELAGTVSSLADLHAVGVKFGQDVRDIDAQAVRTFSRIQANLDATGGTFDAATAKLLNMRDQLLKIPAVAEAAARAMRQITIAQGTDLRGLVGVTPDRAQLEEMRRLRERMPEPITPIGRPWITERDLPAQGQGMATPAQALPEVSTWAIRTQQGLELFRNGLGAAADSVRQQLLPLSDSLRQLVNPIYFFGGVLNEIAGAIKPVMEPLRPIFAALGQIVQRALVPVFQALAPALESLLPLFDALMQVIGPILTALAPLFRALGAILEPLFPIFKLLGIAATYIGQAFGIAANIVLRAVGNIIIGFGKIVEALARAIDALPFVSAKGAIRFAQGIQDFGRGMLYAADEMKAMANDMATAREQIRGVGVDSEKSYTDAAGSVDKLGDAAERAASAMLFVPTIFRMQQRLAELLPAQPLGTAPLQPALPNFPQQPAQPPQLVLTPEMARQALPAPVAAQPPLVTEARPGVPVGMTVQSLTIVNPASGADVVDEIDEEYRRRSMATFGTTQRVGEL